MSIVTSVLDVFDALSEWLITFITALFPMFYNPESGLTLLGVLAVCGLGVSIFFLAMGIIQKFFHWRG